VLRNQIGEFSASGLKFLEAFSGAEDSKEYKLMNVMLILIAKYTCCGSTFANQSKPSLLKQNAEVKCIRLELDASQTQNI
jgi:hypothetical protein